MKKISVNHAFNKTIMYGSPIDDIAHLFDEKIPAYISAVVSLFDDAPRQELMRWIEYEYFGDWDDDYYDENKHDLIVYIAAEFLEDSDWIQKEGYENYDDYLMYIFFFTQYRRITGKNLRKSMTFADILVDYRAIENEAVWNSFVYSDDPEGERDYNLFLYDDYELDYFEGGSSLTDYIDEELADRCLNLMNNPFSDDSISYLRNPALMPFSEENDFGFVSYNKNVPKDLVKDYLDFRITAEINGCIEDVSKQEDTEAGFREIDKLETFIQGLYGDVRWYDAKDEKKWFKAHVPNFFTEEEFLEFVGIIKDRGNMLWIYNYLLGNGKSEYIIQVVKYLRKTFAFALDDKSIDIDTETEAINALFDLTDKVNAFYRPIFEVIAREHSALQLQSVKDPYNVKHLQDALGEIRFMLNEEPSDAWLLQEQIYLCAYRFEELCTILQLMIITLNKTDNTSNAKRIANEYRYLFKNITNHIFRDFLSTDAFVDKKQYRRNDSCEIESPVGSNTSNIMIENLLMALDTMLQTDDLKEVSDCRSMMVNSLRVLGGDEALIESVLLKLENALVDKCRDKKDFSFVYDALKKDLDSCPVKLSDTTINTLATAEYFYKKYIIEAKEQKSFDYSCFAILYFQVLESAINELLFLPYRQKYGSEIVEKANQTNGHIDDYYCVPAKVTGMLIRKGGRYSMAPALTLGGLAFFCLGLEYNPEKKELVKLVRTVFNDSDFDVKKIVSFGKELLEISKRRNIAAHASENLSADSFVEAKDYVFNKKLTTEMRNMLSRFLGFFK